MEHLQTGSARSTDGVGYISLPGVLMCCGAVTGPRVGNGITLGYYCYDCFLCTKSSQSVSQSVVSHNDIVVKKKGSIYQKYISLAEVLSAGEQHT